MKFIQAMANAKRNFRREDGTFSVEAVLMFPLLIWAFVAMFVFFEGLREGNINLKATYTVSDLLSRETELIDQDYLEGMNRIYAWLSRSPNDVNLRVTVVRYDQANDEHIRVWSRGVGKPDLTQEQVDEYISPQVPIMADADSAIVVETWTTYSPVMDIGLTESDIYNVVVTAPRFSEQLNFAGLGDGSGTVHDDGTGGEDETL
jgi:hypothetical protein